MKAPPPDHGFQRPGNLSSERHRSLPIHTKDQTAVRRCDHTFSARILWGGGRPIDCPPSLAWIATRLTQEMGQQGCSALGPWLRGNKAHLASLADTLADMSTPQLNLAWEVNGWDTGKPGHNPRDRSVVMEEQNWRGHSALSKGTNESAPWLSAAQAEESQLQPSMRSQPGTPFQN